MVSIPVPQEEEHPREEIEMHGSINVSSPFDDTINP